MHLALLKKIVRKIDAGIEYLESIPYFGVLVKAAVKGMDNFDKDMAASIAFYTFLSLFPLILGLTAIGAYFLDSDELQLRIQGLIVDTFPVSSDFVTRTLTSLIEIRGAMGIASIIVLLWSASKMVGAFNRSINHSLGMPNKFPYVVAKFRYFGLTLIIVLGELITMGLTPIIRVIADMRLEMIGDNWNNILNTVASGTSGLILSSVIIVTLYKFFPYKKLPWKSLLPGIVVATVLVELGKELFTLYVERASNYSAVYGSISSVIVLLLSMYYTARIILYGAEIISVVHQKHIENETA